MSSVRVIPQATLEQYLKDYVWKKNADRVELYLTNAISIKHVTKKGNVLLATLWANVLQHPNNFPNKTFPYKKLKDKTSGVEKLILKAEDITFTVFMKTGTLMLQGSAVYEWFTRRFREVLDNYDEEFQKTWAFRRTLVEDLPPEEVEGPLGDPNTETEDYLLLRTRQHTVDQVMEQRVQDDADALIEGIGNIALDKPLWEGAELDSELQSLDKGAVKDGFSYIHKLWKSLLSKWFSTIGTKVYMASPFLDADRLADLVDICLNHRTEGDLEVFYVRFKCDEFGRGSVSDVKKRALQEFGSNSKGYIEYKIFRRMICPVRRFHCKFLAGVNAEGQAEVVTTSANFHGNHFIHENMETVMFQRMDAAEFLERYVDPIASPVVATT